MAETPTPAWLDNLVDSTMETGKLPGVALAIVAKGKLQFASAYGFRDFDQRLPMAIDTAYPIASTSKAFNTALLAMLVDERIIAWDAPVCTYLPGFRLADPIRGPLVTLRDLVTMRTGLARHDWSWIDHPFDRAALVDHLASLELTDGFRERFRYNNLGVTLAGHIAEVVTGQSWEQLVQERLLDRLDMRNTGFERPAHVNVTQGYHENHLRAIVPTPIRATEHTAPSGGAIYSTVEDMARWIGFNLRMGVAGDDRLIQPATFAELHCPQIVVEGVGSEAVGFFATYGLGWGVNNHNGCMTVSHTGLLNEIDSEVLLAPEHGIGIVSFTNLAGPLLARPLNRHILDAMLGRPRLRTIRQAIESYEAKIAEMEERNQSVARVAGTAPSHALADYAGRYDHPSYGRVEISVDGDDLRLKREGLQVGLRHWHYDAWVGVEDGQFPIYREHPFERSKPLLFGVDAAGEVVDLAIKFDPSAAPIRLLKQRGPATGPC